VFAQSLSSLSTTFTNGTLTVGNCTITGVTSLTINGNTLTTNNTGTLTANCTGSGTPPPPSVNASFANGTSYIIGSATNPVVNWSSSDGSTVWTCSATATGFTAQGTAAATSGTITLTPATPAAGTVTVALTCTSGALTSSPSLQLTVSSGSSGGGGGGGGGSNDPTYCASTQLSTGLPISLTRQCSGDVYWGMYRNGGKPYVGVQWLSADTLFNGSFGSYAMGGATFSPYVSQGSYMALAFNTGSGNGKLHLTVNPTYGNAGMVSISKTPGDFTAANINNFCGGADQGDEIAATGAKQAFGYCNLDPNTTYYLNITTVHADGSVISPQPIAWGLGNS
jgi:hypothetical protein